MVQRQEGVQEAGETVCGEDQWNVTALFVLSSPRRVQSTQEWRNWSDMGGRADGCMSIVCTLNLSKVRIYQYDMVWNDGAVPCDDVLLPR